MNFNGDDDDGLSLARLLGQARGQGAPGSSDPIAQALADIAQRARLPRVGGLFGGDYARFMADRTPAVGLGRPEFAPPLQLDGAGAPGDPIQFVHAPVRATALDPAQSAAAPRPAAPAAADDDRAKQLDSLVSYLSRPDVEGSRPYVYRDSRQILTVGVGHKVMPEDKLGEGDEPGDQRIKEFLHQDAAKALDAARSQAAEAGISDPAFITALGSVNFQLGTGWNTGKNGHRKTWALIRRGDYAAAADEAARSEWYKQMPKRVVAFQKALRALPPRAPETR